MENERFGRKEAKKTFKHWACVGLLVLAGCQDASSVPKDGIEVPGLPSTRVAIDPIEYTQEMYEKLNETRMKYGLLPLSRNNILDEVAKDRLKDMTDKKIFGHDIGGKQARDYVQKNNYGHNPQARENLAAGISDPDKTTDALMASPPHRANILSDDMREVGIAFLYKANDPNDVVDQATGKQNGPYYWYTSEVFGSTQDEYGCYVVGVVLDTGKTNLMAGSMVTLSVVDTGVFTNGQAGKYEVIDSTGNSHVLSHQGQWRLPGMVGPYTITVKHELDNNDDTCMTFGAATVNLR